MDYWKSQYDFPEPRREDYADSADYVTSYNAWYMGFFNFYENQTQKASAPVETTPTKPIESAGSDYGNNNQIVDDDTQDKYPLGSYVDPDGAVWSPDGTCLSPAPAAVMVPPEGGSDQNDLLSSPDPDAPAVTAGSDSHVWYVRDIRPKDAPAEVIEGLKSLVTSIFGEYTPVTTTSVITETVGNETHQYLLETVAPGAAGVDYEWLAGVVLFGILLFCFMKLLGGVLK